MTRRKDTFLSRREFLQRTAWLAPLVVPFWTLPPKAWGTVGDGRRVLTGPEFDLCIGATSLEIDGRRATATTVNGQLPGPLLRWREGDEVTLRVTNTLTEDTSIHWHGIILPFYMDGVPGITFPGIAPGETFIYRFPIVQSGTYWYHSHSGLQEQLGLYGPLIIEPRETDEIAYDREHVMVLSDWTFLDPYRLFAALKKNSHGLNYQRNTLPDLIDGSAPLSRAIREQLMWSRMRMAPTDIADVGANTYTYLVNGSSPSENWTGLFRPGERVRLRVINASAMTIFNFRIPGLPMSVVQADGQDLQPLEVDEFQIGVAETYDVVVQPDDIAYTIMAETIDRSGYARATLAPRAGMNAAVPP
ncbi:MAG: copper resistance system multicopper oxidase, partial [Bdellovibrionales bacterium]|nr:copper resistance system multicopper oxidase [Bdellovibrionales bacterium]